MGSTIDSRIKTQDVGISVLHSKGDVRVVEHSSFDE